MKTAITITAAALLFAVMAGVLVAIAMLAVHVTTTFCMAHPTIAGYAVVAVICAGCAGCIYANNTKDDQ